MRNGYAILRFPLCAQGHPLIAGSHADSTRTSAAVAALPKAKLHFEIDE
jgi:hypothetical protein